MSLSSLNTIVITTIITRVVCDTKFTSFLVEQDTIMWRS